MAGLAVHRAIPALLEEMAVDEEYMKKLGRTLRYVLLALVLPAIVGLLAGQVIFHIVVRLTQ